MKILERYILSEFIKLLVIAVAAFVVLFLMIDIFENMDALMRHHVPAIPSILFFAYKIPFILTQTSPVATLLATLLTLGALSRHGEITAIKSGGVRLLRVLAPVLVAGVALSLAVIVMNETVVPAAQRKVDFFRRQWFGMQGQGFGVSGIWMRTDGGILNVRQMDLKKNELNGVTLYKIAKPFNVTGRINARTVLWEAGAWKAPAAEVWRFAADRAAEKNDEKAVTLPDIAPPEDFVTAENAYRNMGILELNSYVNRLVSEGYNAARFKIDLYGKVTFPLVNFIMVLVGVPFALKTGRHGGIAVGIGISIIVAFSFWVVFAIMRSVGVSGAVPPLVAAVFPDLLFFAAGALMLGYVKE